MEIFEGHRALFRPLFAPAIALGNFDGLHRGHQRLLEAARQAAVRLGGDSVVFTFDPHPAQVLAPQFAPPLLSTRERKLELIADAGIAACVVEPFTRELAGSSPDDFLQTILCDVLGARHVVVGYDFTYGRKRAGTTQTLQAFGEKHGFEVEIIDPVSVDGIVASSTKVREFLGAGKLDGAALLLGRDYDVDGAVVRGAGRGRTIGIPTANVATEGVLLPKAGVYAVRVTMLDGGLDAGPGAARRKLDGVANLGTNPTFVDAGTLSLEVHLFEFSDDIYDRRVRVEFVERLRGEKRFEGVEGLVKQIHRDIAESRRALASRTGGQSSGDAGGAPGDDSGDASAGQPAHRSGEDDNNPGDEEPS